VLRFVLGFAKGFGTSMAADGFAVASMGQEGLQAACL